MIQIESANNRSNSASDTKTLSVTSRVSPWLAPAAYFLGRSIVLPAYFGNIETIGQENVPTSGATILAPTHRSRWDPLMVAYAAGREATGRDPRFMTSANEMKGLQGLVVRRLGAFPIDTDRPGIGSLRHGIELLEQDEMLVVFPEGGIFRDGKIHNLKAGLGRMALHARDYRPEANVRVVPICLHYSTLVPRWGCDVRIQIGSPLSVTDYATDSIKSSAKQLMADLQRAMEALNQR
jgi:1-acyl-sn-glycerol-3-phosphate acyltransferase